jgi:hypothetical protein
MTRLQLYIDVAMRVYRAIRQALAFVQRARDRREAALAAERKERADERDHQRLLIEGIATKLVEFSRVNQEGVMELARAQAATADALQTWIKGFHVPPETDMSPSVVREEDEWELEQERLAEDPTRYIASLPPEFALALSLQKLDAGDFDREGRDIP